MTKTLKHIINMKAALLVNTFIYYFKRLWGIGRLVPDTLYSNERLKKYLSIITTIFRQLIDFIEKPAYLCCFIAFPILLITKKHPEFAGQEFAMFIHILFFLNGIIGAFGDSQIFTVTRDKITCIKYMQMRSGQYIKASFGFKYIPFLGYYLICLIGAAVLLGRPIWQGLILWLMFFSFRMMGEAFQLFVFDRTGKILARNMIYEWTIIFVGMAAAYVPFAMGVFIPAADFFLNPFIVVIYTAVGCFSLYYIYNYKSYNKKLPHSLDINFLLSSAMKASAGAAFKEVEMKEKDTQLSEAVQLKARRLKGYPYINALFFARHRRQLIRPVYYRLIVTAVIFAASIILYFADKPLAVTVSRNITVLLPSFVFLMYCMTVADKACRAMFYNCDKDMLHYAYYRQPKIILKNFKIRLMRISIYNVIVAVALCLVLILFCLICGTSIFTMDMLLFCVTILLLSILFTAHHLGLYYIFQPYSESLRVKNPFFSVINTGMYFLCFMCLQIRTGGLSFTMLVLIFTVLYIGAALILVYRLAPKSFRVK